MARVVGLVIPSEKSEGKNPKKVSEKQKAEKK